MSAMQETEVKLLLDDLEAVARRIQTAGGLLTAPRVLERNVRYDNAAGDFAVSGTVLRMRHDTRARLTYKEDVKAIGAFSAARFEAEVEVSDYDAMAIMLEKLGFRPVWRYEKYRTTYTLMETEIVLDELPIGRFVEIEGESDAAIGAVLATLGLLDAPRIFASYALLFRTARDKLGFPMTDLTFAAFADYVVPPDVFL